MNDLARRIIGHCERHAVAWDADRRNTAWNDQCWPDSFVKALPKGAAVLDPGCGSGCPVAPNLAENGFHVTGVDTSPTMISLCRRRLPATNGSLRTCEARRLFIAYLHILELECRQVGQRIEPPCFHVGGGSLD
jgi:2-polyprenyl-3-methyl-5-hydroxy-6-metoxy-1,4-benzoquinol methylase